METLRIPGKGKAPTQRRHCDGSCRLAYENLQRPAEVLILDTLYHECTTRKVDLNGVKELICIKHKSWGHWLTLRMLIDDHTIECYDPNSGRLDHKACDELRDDFFWRRSKL
jgi:hypothetical protein